MKNNELRTDRILIIILIFIFIVFIAVVGNSQTYTVTGTYYNPIKGQCDDDPLTTADNSIINLKLLEQRKIKWVALSRNLLNRWGGPFYYGDTIVISCNYSDYNGKWVIHDTMNSRFKDHVDFLVNDNKFPGRIKNIIIKKWLRKESIGQ